MLMQPSDDFVVECFHVGEQLLEFGRAGYAGALIGGLVPLPAARLVVAGTRLNVCSDEFGQEGKGAPMVAGRAAFQAIPAGPQDDRCQRVSCFVGSVEAAVEGQCWYGRVGSVPPREMEESGDFALRCGEFLKVSAGKPVG